MYKNKKERKKENKEVLLDYVCVCVCVVTSTFRLARLICVPHADDPKNEKHSRRLVAVQYICWTMCLYSSAICDVLDGEQISQRWEKEGIVNMYKTVIFQY